jgi:adenylate cyclase
MCRIIDETHGVVDKFIGDEIMTLYGAPVSLDFHAVKAVEAAILMIEDLSIWNKKRKTSNLTIFEIGIGIHTGIVYTGNMGAENRLNYTAIGSNVNQASRICSVAKPMQILISEETLHSPGVKERFVVRKLDPVQLKGIGFPVQVYEVLGKQNH